MPLRFPALAPRRHLPNSADVRHRRELPPRTAAVPARGAPAPTLAHVPGREPPEQVPPQSVVATPADDGHPQNWEGAGTFPILRMSVIDGSYHHGLRRNWE